MKFPIITKFRSMNCGLYSAYTLALTLLLSWVPMCIHIWLIPIFGTLIMVYIAIISIFLLIISLFFIPIEILLIKTNKLKYLEVNIKKKQGLWIICLALPVLFISLRFCYAFWVLGIINNPALD